ncbi:MAG: hypothetical protein H7840_16585 [Alphaproteobacteria bacterium]
MQRLKPAVEAALDEIVLISRNGPKEVKPKEEQLRSAMCRHYSNQGFLVHVEAGYPDSGAECDLRVAGRKGGRERWIEIKTAWGGKGWNGKPAELAAGWESDLCKLRQLAPEGSRRYLVVFGFFDRPLDGSRLGLQARIAEVRGRLLFALPERPFTWRSTSLAVVRAWAWEG